MVKINRSYGLDRALTDVFPRPVIAARAPTTGDKNHPIGREWVRTSTNQAWILTSVVAGSATWSLTGPGASDVDTLTGDGGGAISPTGGTVILAGGINITTAGTAGPGTITYNLDAAITLATSVTSPIYTSAAGMAISAPAANDITMKMGDAVGAQKISFTDSADAEQASLDSDGTLTVVEVDGILGANTPTAITGTTIVANTSVTSPIYTSTGAVDTNINAVASQDIIIKMGDNAAVNKVSFVDSDSAEVANIDSNGGFTTTGLTFTGLLTANASALINTAGATLNLATDNTAGTVNIAHGTTIRAVAIATVGGVAHTVAIGSASGGTTTIDTAAGISLDAATASNFTVTGAADLTIGSTAGGVDITSGEAAADAISLDATAGGGGITLAAGTAGILIGNQADCTTLALGDFAPTATRTITIGGGTVITAAVTDTIDIAPDGATTNANSIKTVNINTGTVATGELLTNIASGTVTSGTHTTEIATGNRAAGTMALNIMTGTGTKTCSLGNADGLTTSNILGPFNLNVNQNNNTAINTGTSTGTVDIGNVANSGAMTLGSSSTLDVDIAGALQINSSGAAISIGNDDIDQAVNLGTDGERTVTVGSINGAAALVLQSGTTDIIVTGTVKEVTSEFTSRSGDTIPAVSQSPVMTTAADTGGAATGANGDVNLMQLQDGVLMEQFIIGTQTIIAPRMDANGLLISLDLTVAEGAEYNFGAGRTNSRHAFTIGTSAAFFLEVGFRINDMDGAAPYIIGFRKSEANNAAFGTYTDYAAIGMIAASQVANIITVDELNGTGQTITNTTDAWGGDGTINTLKVLVSSAGVVTYTVNGAAPTAAGAITFDGTDVVCPFIDLVHSASATEVNITSFKCGFQA